MAAPSTTLKVWFENQSADIDYDSAMRVSRLQMLAMQKLCSGKSPPLDPRDYQFATPDNQGIPADTTLGTYGIAAGADLLLVKKYRQGASDIHWAIILGVYTGLLLVAALAVLAELWPWSSADLAPATTRSITLYILFFKVGTFAVGPEVLLLYIVLLSGIIGACVWSLYVLSAHLSSSQDFSRVWAGWYLVRPFLGAGLALILYALLRAGLFSTGSTASSTSVLGISALSFLVGFFTENAVHKLHDIADTVFGNPPSGQPTTAPSTPAK